MTSLRVSILLVVVASCGRVNFDSTSTDAGGLDARDGSSCIFTPWSAPVAIGELSTLGNENGSQVSPDGLTIYFTRANDLYTAKRQTRTAMWGPPLLVPVLSTPAIDGDPTFLDDELEIYYDQFTSSACLSTSSRSSTAVAWSTPVQMAAFCAGVQAGGPYLTADGLTLLYTESTLSSGEGQIKVSTRATRSDAFTPGSVLAIPIGMPHGYGALSSDQLTIYFEAGNLLELWTATRATTGAAFGDVTQLTEVGSTATEEDPSITADGLELFFDSDRGGNFDIYTSTRNCL